MTSLAYNYRLGASTTADIIWETLGAIYNCLKPLVLPEPTEATWLNVASGFLKRWNVPNCCGSVDGKHVRSKVHYITHSYNVLVFLNEYILEASQKRIGVP